MDGLLKLGIGELDFFNDHRLVAAAQHRVIHAELLLDLSKHRSSGNVGRVLRSDYRQFLSRFGKLTCVKESLALFISKIKIVGCLNGGDDQPERGPNEH